MSYFALCAKQDFLSKELHNSIIRIHQSLYGTNMSIQGLALNSKELINQIKVQSQRIANVKVVKPN
jgi:hypothetical protein